MKPEDIKVCSKCTTPKPASSFQKDKYAKGGLYPQCKDCKNSHGRTFYSENRERLLAEDKEYRSDSAVRLRRNQQSALWKSVPENKQRIKELQAGYRLDPEWRARDLRNQAAYRGRPEYKSYRSRLNSLPETKVRARKRHAVRVATDIPYRLRKLVRNRLKRALSAGFKTGSAIRDLGCSIEELKAHLESRFLKGMSWGNYGNGEGMWNIDHIMPLSKFNLEDRQHIVLACHYLNLQPLWHIDNLKKGRKAPANDTYRALAAVSK